MCEKIDILKESLKQFLATTRLCIASNAVTFVHNKRYQYQLEVPGEMSKLLETNLTSNPKLPHSFVLLGKVRGGRKRFTCDLLLELSRKLSEAERIYKKRMVPLIRDMFLRFYSYREHWTNVVNCIAELDVLCSLANFSVQSGMCKPTMLRSPSSSSTGDSSLEIRGLRNPLF